jgi:hypothetical protein
MMTQQLPAGRPRTQLRRPYQVTITAILLLELCARWVYNKSSCGHYKLRTTPLKASAHQKQHYCNAP